MPAIERIRSKLVKQPNECEHWTGFIDPSGYGRLGYRGCTSVLLQRAVYEEFIGPIPVGYEIDHVCHTSDVTCAGGVGCSHRRCGNWQHLEAVPRRVNNERGRSFASKNAAKTHCQRGHEYTSENTYRNTRNARVCIACFVIRLGYPPVRLRAS